MKKNARIAGRFLKVGENPLVIGFIGNIRAENLSEENIEYLKGFYNAKGKQHRIIQDYPQSTYKSKCNNYMIFE